MKLATPRLYVLLPPYMSSFSTLYVVLFHPMSPSSPIVCPLPYMLTSFLICLLRCYVPSCSPTCPLPPLNVLLPPCLVLPSHIVLLPYVSSSTPICRPPPHMTFSSTICLPPLYVSFSSPKARSRPVAHSSPRRNKSSDGEAPLLHWNGTKYKQS